MWYYCAVHHGKYKLELTAFRSLRYMSWQPDRSMAGTRRWKQHDMTRDRAWQTARQGDKLKIDPAIRSSTPSVTPFSRTDITITLPVSFSSATL